jgi:hypothetical protein
MAYAASHVAQRPTARSSRPYGPDYMQARARKPELIKLCAATQASGAAFRRSELTFSAALDPNGTTELAITATVSGMQATE